MDSTGQQIQSSDTSPDARYIGVDIAKAHLDAWDSARPGAKRFPQDEAGLEAFVCWLSEESAPIENLPENLPGSVSGGFQDGHLLSSPRLTPCLRRDMLNYEDGLCLSEARSAASGDVDGKCSTAGHTERSAS